MQKKRKRNGNTRRNIANYSWEKVMKKTKDDLLPYGCKHMSVYLVDVNSNILRPIKKHLLIITAMNRQ
jgi:hypothetical protein